jgi:UDP-N-acetylglucosamine 2-epimerase (non-hydrolysing)
LTRVVHAVGARPNFVKMAPVVAELGACGGFEQCIVHTGQHYDPALSDEVLSDLAFPAPDRFLGVGSGSHAEQTGRVLIAFEQALVEVEPDLVVVSGDVNSTLACALAAAKLDVPVAHVEAGLRSFDWTMPEEINRVLTDRLSTFLFTHSPEARTNLLAEGIDPERVHEVGNTMIDSLHRLLPAARERAVWRGLGLEERGYVLVTLHRPSNVDEPSALEAIARELVSLGRRVPVVFPLHPRTRAQLESTGELARLVEGDVRCLDPLGYLDFLSLQTGAGAILTDSGGVQEEASILGVRCYTLRRTTERPITLTQGTNVLLGEDPEAIRGVEVAASLTPCTIPLWDGRAAARLVAVLEAACSPNVAPGAVSTHR